MLAMLFNEFREMMIKGTVLYSSTGNPLELELDSMLASVGNRRVVE